MQVIAFDFFAKMVLSSADIKIMKNLIYLLILPVVALYGCSSIEDPSLEKKSKNAAEMRAAQKQARRNAVEEDRFEALTGGLPSKLSHANMVEIGKGKLLKIAKSDSASIIGSVSSDGGATWSSDFILKYEDGSKILNPNSYPQIYKMANGTLALLFYNNSSKSYSGGNPIWISGGRIDASGDVKWSQPEILVYNKNYERNFSLPNLLEKDNSAWILTRSGKRGVLNRASPRVLRAVSNPVDNVLATRDLVFNPRAFKNGGATFVMPKLKDVSKHGITIDFVARFTDSSVGKLVFDNMDNSGKGIQVLTDKNRSLRVIVNDGKTKLDWTTDTEMFQPGKLAHIAIILDGRANVLMSVANGKLNDGNGLRPFGWYSFYGEIGSVNGAIRAEVGRADGVEIKRFRIYSRALLVSEVLSNYRYERM